MIDRRTMMGSAALLAALAPAARAANAQDAKPAAPGREEKLAARAAETRRRLHFDGRRFSGEGYDWLADRARDSLFFLLGEEHGIAENPKLAAQLFADLVPAGYSKLAIEISPPMAEELDAALARGGLDGLRAHFAEPGAEVAFFGMREEAELLAAARAALPGAAPFLWGTDYEVGADRRLIAILEEQAPPSARPALAALKSASAASWAEYGRTRNPMHIYSFAGDPALVRAVRAAWPRPDARSASILDTLEETFEINRLWTQKRPWESNERRGALLRRNFLHHWRAEKAAGRSPRVFMKYGASHVMRGRNSTETFDLGSLVHEIAAIEGGDAFGLLVLPGPGSEIAAFDPTSFVYKPVAARSAYLEGLKPILGQAYPDAFTLFDTRPLRPLLGYSRTPADPDLMRMVHGFDAILVMSGSTASANLTGG